MLGCPCFIVSELVEVYEGFVDREDEGRMVPRGRVGVYGRGMEAGVSDLRYLSQKGCMVVVVCASCGYSGGRRLGCVSRYAHKSMVQWRVSWDESRGEWVSYVCK